MERLQQLVAEKGDSVDKDVKSILDAILSHDNVPRKKPKFVNFVKNVLGGGRRCNPATIDKVQNYDGWRHET